jgi:predicted DsbA family dithiol-disulfide isomerase
VEWLPFDLHPEYPPEGIPRSELLRRYGEDFHRRLEASFERDGLVYNPPPDVVPNSHSALRLTELARDQGKHGAAHDRLMQAYWEEARNIGDPGVLHAIAAELGVEGAADAIEGRLYADAVASATSEAHAVGINAIPAFVLDKRLLVLGAQPDEVFAQAFAHLRSEAGEPK